MYALRVRELGGQDQCKDMIRVHWKERNNTKNGSIVRVRVNGVICRRADAAIVSEQYSITRLDRTKSGIGEVKQAAG